MRHEIQLEVPLTEEESEYELNKLFNQNNKNKFFFQKFKIF